MSACGPGDARCRPCEPEMGKFGVLFCPRHASVDGLERKLDDARLTFIEMADQGGRHLARADALEQRIAVLEEALQSIDDWGRAYPLGVFPEPDFKSVAKVLKDAGHSLDTISASNMRHVVKGVAKIACAALAAHRAADAGEKK